jgi:cathepsin A (carboxypeptidase C)
MNTPATRTILGVDPSVGNFTACSPKVSFLFNQNMDEYTHQTQFYVAELLERGVRVLVYAGTYDWICNWVGFFFAIGCT